jgi:hypothetical protein
VVENHSRVLKSYLEVTLSGAETAFGSIQTTFDSIQPPKSEAADHLRSKLDAILSDGADGLATLRIAARRGDTATLVSVSKGLDDVSRKLLDFSENPTP